MGSSDGIVVTGWDLGEAPRDPGGVCSSSLSETSRGLFDSSGDRFMVEKSVVARAGRRLVKSANAEHTTKMKYVKRSWDLFQHTI